MALLLKLKKRRMRVPHSPLVSKEKTQETKRQSSAILRTISRLVSGVLRAIQTQEC